jgi:hypothetical protein
VGGRSLAAEEVCGGDLDTLGSLVDENLVRVEGERFGMFETIREYAADLPRHWLECHATRGPFSRASRRFRPSRLVHRLR